MAQSSQAQYKFDTIDEQLVLHLIGTWTNAADIPGSAVLLRRISTLHTGSMAFNTEQLDTWDTGLMTFLIELIDFCEKNNIRVDKDNLPDGTKRLLNLAYAVPERKGARRTILGQPVLAMIGNVTIEMHRTWNEMLSFVGDLCRALSNLIRGRARMRGSDLFYQVEAAGPSALMIITLISTLVGMILAFVGAVQLRLFGAEIFIANLVGLGMAREMGAIMTAIIMAGRSGSAYAAQLGTMQVNEEIDALKTMGISPIEFLVLPRLLALCITMPLLCIYSIFMGILGGAIVSAALFELSFYQYYQQIQDFVPLKHFMIGIVKAAVFGVLVSTAGCFRGLQCGRSASAVGFAATSAVVTSLVLIIVADAVITVVCQVLGV